MGILAGTKPERCRPGLEPGAEPGVERPALLAVASGAELLLITS